MTRTILFSSARFALVSYGGGLSYAVHDHAAKRSLFMQGEDAATLLGEVGAWERNAPDGSLDDLYAAICDEYSDAMTYDASQVGV